MTEKASNLLKLYITITVWVFSPLHESTFLPLTISCLETSLVSFSALMRPGEFTTKLSDCLQRNFTAVYAGSA